MDGGHKDWARETEVRYKKKEQFGIWLSVALLSLTDLMWTDYRNADSQITVLLLQLPTTSPE